MPRNATPENKIEQFIGNYHREVMGSFYLEDENLPNYPNREERSYAISAAKSRLIRQVLKHKSQSFNEVLAKLHIWRLLYCDLSDGNEVKSDTILVLSAIEDMVSLVGSHSNSDI